MSHKSEVKESVCERERVTSRGRDDKKQLNIKLII